MPNEETIIENSVLFAGLPEKDLKRIKKIVRVRPVKKGKTLFEKADKADGCFAIIEGAFKIVISNSEGDAAMLAVLGEGDIIGEMSLIDGDPRSATVIALRDSKVAHLQARDFERVADENPAIYRHLLKVMTARLREANETVATFQNLSLEGRLARTLVRMSEEFGQSLDGGRIIIRQKVTQADLARMTGSARENVNRQIGAWRKKKLISRISQYYCIEAPEEFRKLADLQE